MKLIEAHKLIPIIHCNIPSLVWNAGYRDQLYWIIVDSSRLVVTV